MLELTMTAESHGCGGCIETNGHPFHGECPIAICRQEKGHNEKETAGLCLINAHLSFNCKKGTDARTDLPLPHIPLTGGQALAVSWAGYELIEQQGGESK
jgi:hypothetical protein